MSITPSDEELLNAFAKSHDEQAFRQIAERYSGLIFHTALRSLNDRTLAEDVAQRVLGVLAKKAGQVACGNTPLPAWLHRTTILEAKSVRRTESRHHRKKEALMRAPTEPSCSENSAWQEALPHLDAAIDALPEGDRHVILLHYVNELTFPEIARRVGKSAAAVQKQSRRALESLQRILGRRGVTLSLGILTAGLTSEMAKAGPVLLIPALSSLGKTTTSVLVVKKTTVATIVTTLLICGVPLARQQVTLDRLESEIGTASVAAIQGKSASGPRGTKEPSLLVKLARDLKSKAYDMPGYLGAVDYIEGRSNDELIALIREIVSSPMPPNNQRVVFAKVFDTLAVREPESALEVLMEESLKAYLGGSGDARDQLVGALRILSEKNGEKALVWFRENLADIRGIPLKGIVSEGSWETSIRTELAYGLLTTNPASVLEILTPMEKQDLKNAFQRFAEERQPFPVEKIPGYVKSARELLPETEVGETVARLVSRQIAIGKGALPYKSVDALLASESFYPSEVEAISLKAGTQRIHMHHKGLESGILQYKTWLESCLPGGVDHKVGETLGLTILSSEGKNEAVYQAMMDRENLGLGDEAVIGLLATAGHRMVPERVMNLIRSLTDQEFAEELVSEINKRRTE